MNNYYNLTYQEKLKDSRWKERSKQIHDKYENTCCWCGGRDIELNAHHIWYEHGKQPWDYPDECFILLCCDCHNDWHEEIVKLQKNAGIEKNLFYLTIGASNFNNPSFKAKNICEARGFYAMNYAIANGLNNLSKDDIINLCRKCF